MNVRDYFFGRSIMLESRFAPNEIKRRIRDGTRTAWWMRPFRTGPAGGIFFGRVRLRYQSSPFEYNAKPILAGRIDPVSNGSLLRLTYRGRTWFRLFFVFWYLFLAIFAAVLLTVGTDPPLHGTERLFPVVIIGGLAIVPMFMHVIGTRRSEEELDELIDFLRHVAETRPASGIQRRGQALAS